MPTNSLCFLIFYPEYIVLAFTHENLKNKILDLIEKPLYINYYWLILKYLIDFNLEQHFNRLRIHCFAEKKSQFNQLFKIPRWAHLEGIIIRPQTVILKIQV